MGSSHDAFHRAAVVYADVLGEAGLARYRALAETEWAKAPALGPGDEDPDRYGGRFIQYAIRGSGGRGPFRRYPVTRIPPLARTVPTTAVPW